VLDRIETNEILQGLQDMGVISVAGEVPVEAMSPEEEARAACSPDRPWNVY
jgi:hypothetical protein